MDRRVSRLLKGVGVLHLAMFLFIALKRSIRLLPATSLVEVLAAFGMSTDEALGAMVFLAYLVVQLAGGAEPHKTTKMSSQAIGFL